MPQCNFKSPSGMLCGSFAFNLHREGIAGQEFCDRHHWQNEANRLRASMQAVIEEYDDSNPLAIVIEDMRVMLAYDASNATTTGPRATSASGGK